MALIPKLNLYGTCITTHLWAKGQEAKWKRLHVIYDSINCLSHRQIGAEKYASLELSARKKDHPDSYLGQSDQVCEILL